MLYTIGLLTYLQKSVYWAAKRQIYIAFQWEGKPLWAIAVKINIWLLSSDLNHRNFKRSPALEIDQKICITYFFFQNKGTKYNLQFLVKDPTLDLSFNL